MHNSARGVFTTNTITTNTQQIQLSKFRVLDLSTAAIYKIPDQFFGWLGIA